MARIPEEMLHALWRQLHRLVPRMETTDGQSVEILRPGEYNRDAGPDFLNAVVVIGGIKWVGDVEIHLHSRAWAQHGHDRDAAYNAVVLHVVAEGAGAAVRQNGGAVPTLVFPNAARLLRRYEQLFAAEGAPRCGQALGSLPAYARTAWMGRLLASRLEEKAQAIAAAAAGCELGWEEAFYRSLARSLGLKANADALHDLACSTPLKLLYRVRDSPRIVEAMLFGQAGMLEGELKGDAYRMALSEEYAYQRRHFRLQPAFPIAWRYMRMRPAAFPTIRIAQLASLLCKHPHLLSNALGAGTLRELATMFRCAASSYWDTHYSWSGSAHRPKPKPIGGAMFQTLMINTVIPFRFAYAKAMGDAAGQAAALELLEQLPAEANRVTATFADAGVACASAFDSQALIHLEKRYCSVGHCYLCPAGMGVLTCDFKAGHEPACSDWAP